MLYSFLGILIGFWIVSTIQDRAFSAGYWKGRAAGFQLARSRAQIAKQVDEVFDYDKH